MAQLGSARTRQWNLGVAELRITPLAASGKALQSHSVGLIDVATVEVAQESVRLEGGFPRKLVDTAIAAQTANVKATLREYSRRNLQTLLGQGVSASTPVDVATTLAAPAIAGAVSLSLTLGTGVAIGDTLVVFPRGKPELLSIVVVSAIAANTATLNSDTPTLVAYDPANGPIDVFNAHPIALGAVAETKYFGIQLIQRNPVSGRPRVFDFWKGSISSGLTFETSSQDYGSTELAIEILEPAADEYAPGGSLVHLGSIIPNFPAGRMSFGADV